MSEYRKFLQAECKRLDKIAMEALSEAAFYMALLGLYAAIDRWNALPDLPQLLVLPAEAVVAPEGLEKHVEWALTRPGKGKSLGMDVYYWAQEVERNVVR